MKLCQHMASVPVLQQAADRGGSHAAVIFMNDIII